MDLPLDILRLVLLNSKINDVKSLYLVDKTFNSLCCEKSLWLEKFKEKELVMIDDKINTFSQYLDEYKKVSYALYTASCLIKYIINAKYRLYKNMCFFDRISYNNLDNILMSNHPVFTEIKENDNSKEYINISIEIGNEGKIYYGSHNDDNHKFDRQYTEKYNDIIHIPSLISKILYYHPALDIHDVDCNPIIILENSEIELDWNRHKLYERIKYWEKCYYKYEELYF